MNFEEEMEKILVEFNGVSPLVVMRRLKVSLDMAKDLCQKVWLRQHLEARKLAKDLEAYD